MLKNFSRPAIFLIMGTLWLFSCSKLEEVIPEAVMTDTKESSIREFTIKEGQHSSGSGFETLTDSVIQFKATFDSSAVYQTVDSKNQMDINKLYGIADCGSHHHQNSARFGWRWLNEKLEIHAYTYANGEREHQFITSVALNKEYTYSLKLEANQYIFQIENKTITMERFCSNSPAGYKLFPYFGGDETAPHDITISIEDL